MEITDYWKAVADNDCSAVETLLKTTPTLVNERYVGKAWEPGKPFISKDDAEPSAQSADTFTNTALHTAAVNSRSELAEILLRYGAAPNAIGFEDNKGLTPAIVLAAWEGSLETLRVLLDGGADPNLSASAETALYTAAEHGATDKVELLLSRGARHDVFTAAILGDANETRRQLAAYSTLKKARSMKRSRTPFEEAEHHGQSEVLDLLR